MAIMFTPPLRFLTSHMNSQAMCLPFVSIARSQKLLLTCCEVSINTFLFLPLSHRHFVPPIFAVVFCFSLRAFRLLYHVNVSRCADRLLQFIPVLFSDLGYHTFFPDCSGRCSFPWLLLSLRFLYQVTLLFVGFGMIFVRISIHGLMTRQPASGRRFSSLIAAERRFTRRNVCDSATEIPY